jgi:hypothetical protein
MSNYLNAKNKNISGYLTMQYFNLGLFLPEINVMKLMFYNLFNKQLSTSFEPFKYEDFCPDFNDSNFLNLVILYFKSIVNGGKVILLVYSILIFKYKFYFRDFHGIIESSILEKSVKDTLKIIEKKDLDDKNIFEYIYVEFTAHLKENIRLLNIDNEIIKINGDGINSSGIESYGEDMKVDANKNKTIKDNTFIPKTNIEKSNEERENLFNKKENLKSSELNEDGNNILENNMKTTKDKMDENIILSREEGNCTNKNENSNPPSINNVFLVVIVQMF